MTKISKSPERHTFQAEQYVKRCEEEGKEPSEDYLNLYKSATYILISLGPQKSDILLI